MTFYVNYTYTNSLYKMFSYNVELGSVTTYEDGCFSPHISLLNSKALRATYYGTCNVFDLFTNGIMDFDL